MVNAKNNHGDTGTRSFLRQSFSPCFLCVSVVFIFFALNSCDDPKTQKTPVTYAEPAPKDQYDSVTSHKPTDTTQATDTTKQPREPREYHGPTPEVWGTVYYNLPYCSGARPAPELIAELQQYKPLASSTILLKNNSGSYKITTDEKGWFSQPVPVGNYDVYLTQKVNKSIYSVKPDDCQGCLTESMDHVTIRVNKNNDIHITFRCGSESRMRPGAAK